MPHGMSELELHEWLRIREIIAMKWNTPDWWLGLLAGVLFGQFIEMSIVEGVFQPSSDARRWIGLSGFLAFLIVVQVRWWRFRSKNPSAPTH
jgi:hypothetical protein